MRPSLEILFKEMAEEDIESLPYQLTNKKRRKELKKKLLEEYKRMYLSSLGFRFWANAISLKDYDRAQRVQILFRRFDLSTP